MFTLGYNSNGLAHHRPVEALRLLAELGYGGLALTPDVGALDPLAPDPVTVDGLRNGALELGMALAVETGARFVLDARRKHYPSLLDEFQVERQRRVDLLKRCVDLAVELGAPVVSIWAGVAPRGGAGDGAEPPPDAERLWGRLCQGILAVLEHARGSGVALAFEPEPGMFIERPAGYGALVERLGPAGDELRLCLDVGHLLCTGDLPVGDVIRRWGPRLGQVHLDDIAAGIHEHRMFGTGDLDLREALSALLEVGYGGMAAVELSRDSHRGPKAAEEAMGHLRRALVASP